MRITVTNTALLNTGDAAIMLGTEAILRRAFGAGVEIALRDQQAEQAGARYPEYPSGPLFHTQVRQWVGNGFTKFGLLLLLCAALAWRTPLRPLGLAVLPQSLRASLRDFAKSDLIVSAGGTYLVPHYRLGPKLLELLVARLAGRPYVLFTQSLGPFTKRQRLLGWLLRGAALILVRDRPSAEALGAIGVAESRIHRCADAAFALPRDGKPAKQPENLPRVGISVRDWPHFEAGGGAAMQRYLDAMAHLTAHLVERHGARITFVSTCQGAADYWTDDSHTAGQVTARLPEALRTQVSIDGEARRPLELLSLLGGYDLYVSTRMHGAILALQAQVPVIAVSYEFKTVELFTEMKLEDYLEDIESVSGEALRNASDRILADPEPRRRYIAGEVATLRASAFTAAPRLRQALETAA
ncbi:MAG: polysaccharide pyruvyl transferase family protein [Rhodovibrionaceae bacterium]